VQVTRINMTPWTTASDVFQHQLNQTAIVGHRHIRHFVNSRMAVDWIAGELHNDHGTDPVPGLETNGVERIVQLSLTIDSSPRVTKNC